MPHDDDSQVVVAEITDDNRQYLLNLALSAYADEPCRLCGKRLTMDDLRNGAVFAGYSSDNTARAAHKACWLRSPSVDKKPNADWVHQ